jgi:putative ABC transport system ATP-binding protein
MDTNVIVAENVSRIYTYNEVAVTAVDDVSLTIRPGEFTAIVGPSGSGKTTLLNLLSGLDTPSSGAVYLNGKRLSAMSGGELSDFRRDHIGFIFQAYNLIPVLTVAENVEYIMLLQGVPAGERRRRVVAMLKEIGVEEYLDRTPLHLSGGQQQRVAIARAMVSRPSLILADEPTANLDSKTGAGLLDIMHGLNRSTGMTFVFSTHDPKIMERADRLITLRDGRIAGDEVRR